MRGLQSLLRCRQLNRKSPLLQKTELARLMPQITSRAAKRLVNLRNNETLGTSLGTSLSFHLMTVRVLGLIPFCIRDKMSGSAGRDSACARLSGEPKSKEYDMN